MLSGLVGLALRDDAMDRNPVRDVGRIEGTGSSARELTPSEALDLRTNAPVIRAVLDCLWSSAVQIQG